MKASRKTISWMMSAIALAIAVAALVTAKNRYRASEHVSGVNKPSYPNSPHERGEVETSDLTEADVQRIKSRWSWVDPGSVEITVRNIRSKRGAVRPDDVEKMLSFLHAATPPFDSSGFRWVADEVFIVLRECPSLDKFGPLKSIAESHRDHVVRDYALQHIASYAEETNGDIACEKFLRSVMAGADTGLACQALIGLARLHRNGLLRETSSEVLRKAAEAFIKSNDTKHRIAALQIAAELGLSKESEEAVMRMLQQHNTGIVETTSAIGALAQQDSAESRLFLSEWSMESGDARMRNLLERTMRKSSLPDKPSDIEGRMQSQ